MNSSQSDEYRGPFSFDDVDLQAVLYDVLLAYDVPSAQIVNEFFALCRDPDYRAEPVPLHELPDIPEPPAPVSPNSPFGI